MRKFLASTIGVCILASSTTALAQPKARLEVDTSELGGVGPVLKERLSERGSQVLRDEKDATRFEIQAMAQTGNAVSLLILGRTDDAAAAQQHAHACLAVNGELSAWLEHGRG